MNVLSFMKGKVAFKHFAQCSHVSAVGDLRQKSACFCAVVVGGGFQSKTVSVIGHHDALDKL